MTVDELQLDVAVLPPCELEFILILVQKVGVLVAVALELVLCHGFQRAFVRFSRPVRKQVELDRLVRGRWLGVGG